MSDKCPKCGDNMIIENAVCQISYNSAYVGRARHEIDGKPCLVNQNTKLRGALASLITEATEYKNTTLCRDPESWGGRETCSGH